MSEIKNLVCKVTVFHWYGVRFTDTAGKSIKLTPQVGTVVSAGRVSMPAGLNGDGTYGVDIDLPGVAAIPEANISVLVIPTRPAISAISSQYITGGLFYYNTMYANSAASYYSRNDANGVMTAWSAGARTAGDKTTWHPILAVSPVAFWDKRGATTFTSIRLFAASAYMLRQPYADINYSLTGTASGSGGGLVPMPDGSTKDGSNPNNVKDDDTYTVYGNIAWAANQYHDATIDGYIQVMFSSLRTISRVEILQDIWAGYYGNNADGSAITALYYGGAWHDIFNFSWSWYRILDRLDVITGAWGDCTGVRIIFHLHATGSYYYSAASMWCCKELRAYSEPDTEPKNILRYGIGSAIIPSVDYVVSIKEWDF